MSKSIKSFTEAFEKASRRSETFGEGHQQQLDALAEIVEEINAEGTFRAEIKGFMGKLVKDEDDIPLLSVTRLEDNTGQSFFISYGFEPFGGSVTLQLSTGVEKKPLGDKKDGYSLTYGSDRESFLKALGEKMAEKCAARKLGGETVKYAAGRKAAR